MFNKLKNGIKIEYDKISKDSFVICNDRVVGIVKKNDDCLRLDTYLDE